jgi:hypothetical protein
VLRNRGQLEGVLRYDAVQAQLSSMTVEHLTSVLVSITMASAKCAKQWEQLKNMAGTVASWEPVILSTLEQQQNQQLVQRSLEWPFVIEIKPFLEQSLVYSISWSSSFVLIVSK